MYFCFFQFFDQRQLLLFVFAFNDDLELMFELIFAPRSSESSAARPPPPQHSDPYGLVFSKKLLQGLKHTSIVNRSTCAYSTTEVLA